MPSLCSRALTAELEGVIASPRRGSKKSSTDGPQADGAQKKRRPKPRAQTFDDSDLSDGEKPADWQEQATHDDEEWDDNEARADRRQLGKSGKRRSRSFGGTPRKKPSAKRTKDSNGDDDDCRFDCDSAAKHKANKPAAAPPSLTPSDSVAVKLEKAAADADVACTANCSQGAIEAEPAAAAVAAVAASPPQAAAPLPSTSGDVGDLVDASCTDEIVRSDC